MHSLSRCMAADEVDAIGAKRYESQSGGEREIQRTMLELLNQMDGFDARGDVKVLDALIVCMHCFLYALPQQHRFTSLICCVPYCQSRHAM